MTKSLLLNVRCINDNAALAHSLLVELNDKLIERITSHSQMVGIVDAERISSYARVGTWSDFIIDVPEGDELDMKEAVETIADLEVRTECDMLHVGKDYFYFTCYPKNLGDAFLLETVQVPISILTRTEILYVYDGESAWHQ